MNYIRHAATEDLSRISEIIVFNYRINFYSIFRNDDFYFNEMQVINLIQKYKDEIDTMWVYDDGVVKGVIQIENGEIKKLFVEPVFQGKSIGSALIDFAVSTRGAYFLWALEKNTRAAAFYERHGFHLTDTKKHEEGTDEYLVRLERNT